MKNIPSKLFLVIGTNEEQETDFNNLEHEYVCWSQDRTDETDIEYVSLSDRDQFAMEFAKWVSDRYMYNNVSDTWLSLQGNTYTTSEKIFDLYKQSLTKTDKA